MDFNFPEILKIPDLLKIWEINDGQIEDMEDGFDIIDNNQFFDSLNIDAIKSYEKIFNLYPRQSDSLENRRFRIKRIFLEKIPYSYRTIEKNLNALCPCTIERTVASDGYSYRLDVNADVPSPSDLTQVRKYLDNVLPLDMPFALHMTNVLRFKSSSSFTMSVSSPGWDGIIWYSTDNDLWYEWDGSTITSQQDQNDSEYSIYFTGTENTKITGGFNHEWAITGSNVEAVGSIMSLLGVGMKMGEKCFYYMFEDCTKLITPPTLPATTLSRYCYCGMFYSCTKLTTAPELPATTLISGCYDHMFAYCTSLTTAPTLPATTLAVECYADMFLRCNSITEIPEISAAYLPFQCCYGMFEDCSNISFASSGTPYRIPTSGTGEGYIRWNSYMFSGCSGTLPEGTGTPLINTTYYYVPITTFIFEGTNVQIRNNLENSLEYSTNGSTWSTLAVGASTSTAAKIWIRGRIKGGTNTSTRLGVSGTNVSISGNLKRKNDYSYLFYGQTAITDISNLIFPMDCGLYQWMFAGCSSLTTLPTLPAAKMREYCYASMFRNCTGLRFGITGTPYRFPSTGTGTAVSHWSDDMFAGCTGLLPESTGTPTINTTYFIDEGNYIYYTSPESFTLGLSNNTWFGDGVLEYSIGGDWQTWDYQPLTAANSGGNYFLYLRGDGNTCSVTNSQISNFQITPTGTQKINMSGNLDDLLDYIEDTLQVGNCYGLFASNTALNLSGFTLSAHPYGSYENGNFGNMFSGCFGITTPPSLPATTLTSKCYSYLFSNCSNLQTAPALPATTLGEGCYESMFNGCTSLTTPPELPATTLAADCYNSMFWGCSNLQTAPALPATTLASTCYTLMFNGCASLTTAPVLPAASIPSAAYQSMFNGCTSLTTPPELPATTLSGGYCYAYMFKGCTSLTTAPTLPATTLAINCYESMFENCSSIRISPVISATTLTSQCFMKMFKGCSNLQTPPALPATTLTALCYKEMFKDCSKLENLPTLPALQMTESCYQSMFENCTEIEFVSTSTVSVRFPSSGTGTTATNWNTDMFKGCSGIIPEGTGSPVINSTYHISPLTTIFTFESTSNNVYIENNFDYSLSYSKDNGATWTTFSKYQDTRPVVGKILIKGKIDNSSTQKSLYVYGSNVKVSGQLRNGVNYERLFSAQNNIKDASRLIGAEVLTSKCYKYMFSNCSNLQAPPQLPATTLAENCYQYMFYGCTSLTTSPQLPATTLAENCYNDMFNSCTALIFTPVLSATTLAKNCYSYMFYGCTSLTTAPELPATQLANWCYDHMFYNCTSLTTPPELPATTLKNYCYQYMFYNCTSLTTAPQLPATTLTFQGYFSMFENCTGIVFNYSGTPYRIPTSGTGTIVYGSLTDMFKGCSGTLPESTGTPLINTTYYIASPTDEAPEI